MSDVWEKCLHRAWQAGLVPTPARGRTASGQRGQPQPQAPVISFGTGLGQPRLGLWPMGGLSSAGPMTRQGKTVQSWRPAAGTNNPGELRWVLGDGRSHGAGQAQGDPWVPSALTISSK